MIAIHQRKGSFSDRWIKVCTEKNIPFKIVDCHQSDIIEQLAGCRALMWHFTQSHIEDMLIAHAVVRAAESMGLEVFPSSATSWHFDDKVAQKYLLEALHVPMVKSYVFLERSAALSWAARTDYPKVFKLRNGAGSANVILVRSMRGAMKLINSAFNRGFSPVSRWNALRERWWSFRRDRSVSAFLGIARGFARVAKMNPLLAKLPRQRNYAYFQDFVSGNDSDVRVIVIGRRAFAIKRLVREGDFRASGSGKIIYTPAAIPDFCIDVAFRAANALGTQSVAFDFVFDKDVPLIVEISYAFASRAYRTCPGYWRDDGSWLEGSFHAEDFMLEDIWNTLRHGRGA